MNYNIIYPLIFIFIYAGSYAQQTELSVTGSIHIGNNTEASPEEGTLRWTGSDLEIYISSSWTSIISGGTSSGSLTDIDGNSYETTIINGKEWMAENLRTTKYRNGTNIVFETNDTDWENAMHGAYCWYDNNNGFEFSYGKLYNWHAVADTNGLCPTGWHVPSRVEWNAMTATLGGNTVAGGKLKEAGLTYWNSPNTGASDVVNFHARPGGLRSQQFISEGAKLFLWNSDQSGSSAYFQNLNHNSITNIESSAAKWTGMSVRCVKD